jgi:HlyD family secretion protein
MKKVPSIVVRVLLVLLVVAAAAGAYIYYQNTQHNAQIVQQNVQAVASYRTEAIARGSLISQVSATGALLPEQQVNVYFQQPGTVADVLVQRGDRVKAGQVLLRLDEADLQLTVQQAEDAVTIAQVSKDKLLAGPTADDIAGAQANLKGAKGSLNDLLTSASQQQINIAQLKYNDLQDTARRAQEQYDALVKFAHDATGFARRFVPSQDDIDNFGKQVQAGWIAAQIAQTQLQAAQMGADKGQLAVAYAQVLQAQAVLSQTVAAPADWQLARADLSIAQAQTALKQAQLRLSRAELTAPFDGIVGDVNYKVGEAATVASPAVVLVDDGSFHLDVMVDEIDVVKLSAGQPMSITLDALPGQAVGGKVKQIAPISAMASGVVNYVVRLALDPTGADVPLRAGMSATAEIAVARADNVLLVPNWAIRRDRQTGQAYVSLRVGDQLKEVPLVTGLRGDTHTEAVSGVNEGDVAAVPSGGSLTGLVGGSQ